MTDSERKPRIQWLTTRASGRAHTHSADAGQVGWRLHAVEAEDTDTFSGIGRRVALCGLQPRHGWSLDLFIDARCSRCAKKAEAVKP